MRKIYNVILYSHDNSAHQITVVVNNLWNSFTLLSVTVEHRVIFPVIVTFPSAVFNTLLNDPNSTVFIQLVQFIINTVRFILQF